MRVPTTALLPALAGLLLLGGCINIQGDGDHDGGPYRPRTATDLCRREVEHSYESRYRIAYDLPELTTNGTTQTVRQPFTLAARKENFEGPERREIRCTVVDGALTQVQTVR